MQIEIFSDTICPWCFIGKRRLERALAMRPDIEATIHWRAFQLNPWMPAEGMDRRQYLTAKFGSPDAGRTYDTIRGVGVSENIDFRFDLIPRTPNTLNSHRLIRHGAEHGRQNEVVQSLFDAYFVEGRDIGDIETLANIAERTGFDRGSILAYLRGDADRDVVRAEDATARRMGIQGVPCFIIDRGYAIAGAQEPEYFLPLFDLVKNGDRKAAGGA